MENTDKKEILQAIEKLGSDLRGEMATLGTDLRGEMQEMREAHREDIQFLATQTDKKFDEFRKEIRTEIRQSEANTRDFIDKRVADIEGQLAPTIRSVDAKDSALVENLTQKKIISSTEASTITALSPFSAK